MNKRRIKRDFDVQAALLQENDETKTPKKRQWRRNMIWKKEDQVENQSNKRKDPPTELANHLDKAPAMKRQAVHQLDANIQPRQYVPFKRNWRYNRVWRKDMVWKKEEKTSPIAKQADNQTDIVVSPKSKHDVVHKETTPIHGEKQADNQKDIVVSPKSKHGVIHKEITPSHGEKQADNQKDIVISPGTKHDVIPIHKETTPIHGEKNALLKDCTSSKRKRQEILITSIPTKRRLLEAIPWRSVRPHANPRFLWNLETEVELCCDLFEDLHL